jgi:hypothetical protein
MRGKKGSNFQFQRTVQGIIPETCEMIDGGNSECREIVVELHISQRGEATRYCSAGRYLYSTCRRCTWD